MEPIYRTKKASRLNLGTQHRVLKVYQVSTNGGRRLTFDLFTAKSNLRPHTFVWEKFEKKKKKKIIFLVCIKN